MTKAFGYLRVSGRAQEDGDGFPRQRAAIQKYADQNGIEMVGWFEDVQTGKDCWEERKGWSLMMASLNGTRTIIAERMDRVARDVLISELIMADLKKKKVTLLTSSGEDSSDDSPERVMFRQMLSVFASYERASICAKLRGARQRKKTATGRCEGQTPFGEGNKSGPAKPEEIETLRLMREYRAAGASYQEIAKLLNKNGKKAKHGGDWLPAVVYRVMTRKG